MIAITPDPVAFQLGPLSVAWYGIGYAAATVAIVRVAQTEVARRGIDRRHVVNATLLVAVLALIGARLYHVIDDFDRYRNDLAAIVLPPYSGLGLYGGIAGGILGVVIYTRRQRLPLLRSLDAVFPGVFLGQAIARWGNFFNQELYGPPTDLPWGIAIECANRVDLYRCEAYPEATTGFHPLFFYESALSLLGFVIAIYLSRRHLPRLRDGDIAAFWLIWYGATRTLLEPFRTGYNWTLGDIPVATLIGVAALVIGVAIIVWRHRRARSDRDEPATVAAGANAASGRDGATGGAIGATETDDATDKDHAAESAGDTAEAATDTREDATDTAEDATPTRDAATEPDRDREPAGAAEPERAHEPEPDRGLEGDPDGDPDPNDTSDRTPDDASRPTTDGTRIDPDPVDRRPTDE